MRKVIREHGTAQPARSVFLKFLLHKTKSDFMRAMVYREDIERYGYCATEFALSEADRARYTATASRVIDLAQAAPDVHEALTFSLLPEYKGRVNPTLFTVSGALNSADDKIWLHAGYQSRDRAAAVIPERNQPAELRALWEPLESVLHASEVSARGLLKVLGAESLAEAIFHPDTRKRVVLVRTVKYADVLKASIGAELVAGHADQSVATLHWYETHGGWFQAAPYPQPLMSDDDDGKHQAAIRAVRSRLTSIQNDHEAQAAFFFGVGLKQLPAWLRTNIIDLPGCYHAGFKPNSVDEVVSDFAADTSDTERVSSITFMHPSIDIFQSGEYPLATVAECRPQY